MIQSKGDRNKWKNELNFEVLHAESDWLVLYGNANWNGISAFHLYCTLLLSFKKMISLFTKTLQLLANLSAAMNTSVQRKEH